MKPFDRARFLDDLETFVAFETIVCRNSEAFREADRWLLGHFDADTIEVEEVDCHGLTSSIIKPRGSERPNILGDGHIEVVPGPSELFSMRRDGDRVTGRGVADMKTQCLMMVYALRALLDEGDGNDIWLLFSEDEEVGSRYGVEVVVDRLASRGVLPKVVFAPDGGNDFAYVEKEKGIAGFEVEMTGSAAHASRPFLGDNAIHRTMDLARDLMSTFPNPECESDWRPSLSLTTIEGGEARNQIPDRCVAGFDLRITEDEDLATLQATLTERIEAAGGRVRFDHPAPATYYPREAPIARRYLDILRNARDREPEVLHAAGASNGRIYAAADPDIHVLMSSPTVGGSHAEDEWLDIASLEAYYRVVYETFKLRCDS